MVPSGTILRRAAARSLLLAIGAGAGGAAFGQVNPGFESGLAGWTIAGDAGLLPAGGLLPDTGASAAVVTTASAIDEDDVPLAAGALNVSGAAPLYAGGPLEDALGLAPGALDPDPSNVVQAFEGSALSQVLSLNAGDRVSFRWQFASADAIGGDYGFAFAGDQVLRLGGHESVSGSPVLWGPASGWRSGELVVAQGGPLRVGFGVVDVGDFTVSSALAIDGIAVTPIPEPSQWAFLLAGLGAATLLRRRR